ncbi:hypothetical protein SAMN06298214_0251 [Bacteroidales bacterium WCE2004]|nr:hypothetical protein SAMN06298214_0251 [Bacteroidales bacterium WCE2004]
MFKIFNSGGLLPMSLLTVLLVALFFAAWKAPRWVKEIGNSALVLGLLAPLFPLYQLFTTLQQVAGARSEFSGLFDLISPSVLFSAKALLIPVIYGMCIYLVAQVVRIVQKPRL